MANDIKLYKLKHQFKVGKKNDQLSVQEKKQKKYYKLIKVNKNVTLAAEN